MTVPDQIAYMDAAARTSLGLEYKRRLLDALDVRAGDRVLDIGCGPGTDLARLADVVGPDGLVIGVDRDPGMLAEASRRLVDRPNVTLPTGDAQELPLTDAGVDRARTDRVLQHVIDPERVLAEIRRVLRPGGVLGMAEPDWDTLAVADDDVRTSRGFARFVADQVRHPTIGRQLVRWCVRTGFTVRSVEAMPVLFRDFRTADLILGLRRNSTRAVDAGELSDAATGAWLSRLATGPVLAGFTLYLITVAA